MADVEGLVSSKKKSNTKRKANAWCSAVNCSNSDSSNPDISFFRFPSNPERYVLFRRICNYSKLFLKHRHSPRVGRIIV